MKLLIVQFYSHSCCFSPLMSKWFPELYFVTEMLDFSNEEDFIL